MFGYRVTYRQCWGVVIGSEFIFIIPELIKIIWFMFVENDPTYGDIRAFYPLSLMHFFDYTTIDSRWAYPLRALNAFEIAYWFMLVMESITTPKKTWPKKQRMYVDHSFMQLCAHFLPLARILRHRL